MQSESRVYVWPSFLGWWNGSNGRTLHRRATMTKCPFCDVWIDDLWQLAQHVQSRHPEHSFKCPRQDESHIFKYPAHSAFWLNGTCSHCGSIRPEMLFEAIRRGEVLGPTDKNYKVYVGGVQKFYFQHLSEEQQQQFVELLNNKTAKTDGPFYVLPFFMRRV